MKKRNIIKTWSILALVILLTTSCSGLKTFSGSYRKQLESQDGDVKKIQYYNDNSIKLRRELSSSEVGTASGEVKIKNGKYVEIINIKRKTPGVCIEDNNTSLRISFESSDSLNIKFIAAEDYSFYQIGNETSWISDFPKGKRFIYYGDKEYEVISGYYSFLKLKPIILDNEIKEKRTVKGRKIK